MNSPLDDVICSQLAAPAPDAVVALGESLRQRFGLHARAVLFYGSCRRSHDDAGGIVDLYVLVGRYRDAYGSVLPALANRVLAPNVYYLETPFAGRIARAKYAVVSLDQFERGTARWFHPYLWGRFAQPCGLLFAADDAVRERVVHALGAAVTRFARRTLPRLPAEFDAEMLWTSGLMLTFAAELRSERPAKIAALYTEAAAELKARTQALAGDQRWELAAAGRYRNPSTSADRRSSAVSWAVCRAQGKILSVLRLLKASFTFDGGLPYLVWKIERHSGVTVAITPFMQRFPRLGAIGALWRTWRLGGFRLAPLAPSRRTAASVGDVCYFAPAPIVRCRNRSTRLQKSTRVGILRQPWPSSGYSTHSTSGLVRITASLKALPCSIGIRRSMPP
jgi:hypothetical protein